MHAILLTPHSSADVADEGIDNPAWTGSFARHCRPSILRLAVKRQQIDHVRHQILQAARLQIYANLVYANGLWGCEWRVGASACPVKVQTLLLSGR